MSWRHRHTLGDRLPHGGSPDDAFRRYANALRRLLARTETVTLVVLHEFALRYIALAVAADGSRLPAEAAGNAVPFLFDEHAGRAVTSLDAMAAPGQPQPGLPSRPGLAGSQVKARPVRYQDFDFSRRGQPRVRSRGCRPRRRHAAVRRVSAAG